MYTVKNYRTKKALRDAVEAGEKVATMSAGFFPAPLNGPIALEGPHFPHPHTWHAEAIVADGIIVKGSVK